ncbi:MAG: DUF2095 family protein [Candidatus Bathyarchaeota archaeon]|nr:MAG: DUF2095 family protein [Candidatus Bathyarchaeota archaeon]
METEKEKFRKMFPNLAYEMNLGEQKVKIDSVRSSEIAAEKALKARNFFDYYPDIVDFLRRCNDQKQAEEIITYMENRGEISTKYAKKLRQQLKEKGLRSFGPKKEEGHYFKQGSR